MTCTGYIYIYICALPNANNVDMQIQDFFIDMCTAFIMQMSLEDWKHWAACNSLIRAD